jgi:uncharacterized protein (TIGR02391 family)
LTEPNPLLRFEVIARRVHTFTDAPPGAPAAEQHPFDLRSIHPDFPRQVLRLYDDGHYAEATFAAFRFIESEVKRLGNIRGKVGFALMMDVFNETKPVLALNSLSTDSDEDEQRGYRHIFAGSLAGIRNPRGHSVDVTDTPDQCLDYLSLASLLLRRLDDAGLR